MCDDKNCVEQELQIVDYAKGLIQGIISTRREYASELAPTECQKLDEAVDNLVDLLLTAAVRAKTHHEEEVQDS
jgi:hypothetical protein